MSTIKTLPLFPLNNVVFPFEKFNLHIFEPRYKQLINNCLDEGRTFGMPVYLDGKMKEHGTEIKITEVVNRYPDGRMDIRTEGLRVFRLHSFINPMQERLHAGGSVAMLDLVDDAGPDEKSALADNANQVFSLLGAESNISEENSFISFLIGHHLGLSQEQEYDLLTLPTERKRIEFLMEHLEKAIPTIREAERAKSQVRMNGHFKNFKPLDF